MCRYWRRRRRRRSGRACPAGVRCEPRPACGAIQRGARRYKSACHCRSAVDLASARAVSSGPVNEFDAQPFGGFARHVGHDVVRQNFQPHPRRTVRTASTCSDTDDAAWSCSFLGLAVHRLDGLDGRLDGRRHRILRSRNEQPAEPADGAHLDDVDLGRFLRFVGGDRDIGGRRALPGCPASGPERASNPCATC